MTDLLWPGDDRAGDLFSDAAVLAAMLRVETAWLDALVAAGVAPADARASCAGLVSAADLPAIAAAADTGGNPVIPLLAVLRDRLDPPAAAWVHRGLTSQDVLDTAIVLCLRDTVDRLRADLATQVAALARLADAHRYTPMAGRTLTQHAVPITFGGKAAAWLDGVLDARDRLAVPLPAQFGGAAGTRAAPVALAGPADLAADAARTLGLTHRTPWHTNRAPVTRVADALVACTDAWGHIAGDVLLAARPEIGELSEATGGGSSAMPQKRNPVRAVLIRRAALAAPPLAATLHAAAAAAVDERPDGSWHVEWATVRTLARRTVTAGAHTADLLTGLRVHPERMAATLAAARPGIDAEQRRITGTAGGPYRGATDAIIDATLARIGTP